MPSEFIPCLHKIDEQDYLNWIGHDDLGDECRETCLRDWSYRILNMPGFEYFMGIVILLNLVIMVIETDKSVTGDEETWPGVCGWLVLCIFIVELFFRLMVHQCSFWSDAWNLFDFVVVSIDFTFALIGLLAGKIFPVSILRIFRLGKLARAFKVLRVFPELRLLLAGLLGSISAIFWGTILLVFCMLVWAVVAVLYIHPLAKHVDYNDCERCHRAYSSVLQASLTFWQQIVAGDNWGQVTVPVIEAHPETAIFFISVFLSVGMAVTNLILGVVVSVAQRAQDALREEEKAERFFWKMERHTQLLQICKELDMDNDGMLTKAEVYAALDENADFSDSVRALDISDEEFDMVWAIIDIEQKGYVSYKAFVSRLSTMKISDTQCMLSYIKYYMTFMRNNLMAKMDQQHAEAMDAERSR